MGRFISGELRDAYDALGGPRLKYRNMKRELLQWYKTQRVGRTHQYQTELRTLSMKQRESLKLYCMRLQEVAQRAYPHDDKECVKQMKKRLMRTAPAAFLERMEKKEETKEMLELGKRLTWGEIVSLAEREDKKKRKARYYKEEDSDSEVARRLKNLCSVAEVTKVTPGTQKDSSGKTFTNSQYTGALAVNSFVQCQWCGKAGHREESCWIRKGACTLCGGSTHSRQGCSKYKQSRDKSNRRPTCPRCTGAHFGKDCYNDTNKIVLPSLLEDVYRPSTNQALNQ